ncbi:uncharacterized protein METZ01_LOCUS502597, partial [marine metagenome]
MRQFFNFTDSTALIIGGGSGIGKEIALAFCEQGANVIIAGRGEEKLAATSIEINNSAEGTCSYSVVDITSEASIENLMSFTSNKFNGRLNILVNSAGTNIRAPIEDVSLEDFQK